MSRRSAERPGQLRYVVGERLRLLRKFRKETLQNVADHFGVSVPAIRRFETGETSITVDWLERFADYYDIRIESLVKKE